MKETKFAIVVNTSKRVCFVYMLQCLDFCLHGEMRLPLYLYLYKLHFTVSRNTDTSKLHSIDIFHSPSASTGVSSRRPQWDFSLIKGTRATELCCWWWFCLYSFAISDSYLLGQVTFLFFDHCLLVWERAEEKQISKLLCLLCLFIQDKKKIIMKEIVPL